PRGAKGRRPKARRRRRARTCGRGPRDRGAAGGAARRPRGRRSVGDTSDRPLGASEPTSACREQFARRAVVRVVAANAPSAPTGLERRDPTDPAEHVYENGRVLVCEPQARPLHGLALFVGSLATFAFLQLQSGGAPFAHVLVLVAVIAIHELGHWVAMRAF